MASLKEIKSKIRSTARTRTVTKAMEAVSAAKMRKSQNRALTGRPYARAASAILARVSGSKELNQHPLAEVRDIKKSLYVVITSDKGLAGALNSGVLRLAQNNIKERALDASSVSIIAVGRKAQDYFQKRGFAIEAYHANTDTVSTEVIDSIVQEAAARFASGAVDDVRIAYQNFKSTFEQRPTLRVVFPLSLAELEKVVEDILPVRGQSARQEPVSSTQISNYTIEPSEMDVLGAVIPKLAGIFVYHALLETQASEHSARMVAMKGASDKAGEMQHSLQLKFNKARQAAITREVSEITGGMEAMATA
jgi:F-type H+-transporting ATPase subunit gamma